jgi:hypothetical protein
LRLRRWTVFPLNDAVWAMFYYTQLYICAFSFVSALDDPADPQQAHVERASIKAEEEYKKLEQQRKAQGSTVEAQRPPLSLFPRGAAASPDARYILQSCDAARTLLHICVDSLHPGGALPFLPSRYLLWFTYAAIFLLKVSPAPSGSADPRHYTLAPCSARTTLRRSNSSIVSARVLLKAPPTGITLPLDTDTNSKVSARSCLACRTQ